MSDRSESDRQGGTGEQLTSPEIGTGFISGVLFAPNAVQYSVIEAETEQIRAAPDRPVRSVVISGARWRWPNRVVPWDLDANVPNQQRVTDAIAHWQHFTDLTFPRRTPQNANQLPNWITFRPVNGCSSAVGMQGG